MLVPILIFYLCRRVGADLDLLPVTLYMLVVVFGGKEGKSDVTLPASETSAD
jgi:hypothetical protein